jgi:hypothetical protein
MAQQSTPEQKARYLANPRQCVDCGGKPAAGMPRCYGCHPLYLNRLAQGLPR